MIKELKIIYDSRNYTIISYKNTYYCYSFQTLIAKNDKDKIIKLKHDLTQTDKLHLSDFKKKIDDLYK